MMKNIITFLKDCSCPELFIFSLLKIKWNQEQIFFGLFEKESTFLPKCYFIISTEQEKSRVYKEMANCQLTLFYKGKVTCEIG